MSEMATCVTPFSTRLLKAIPSRRSRRLELPLVDTFGFEMDILEQERLNLKERSTHPTHKIDCWISKKVEGILNSPFVMNRPV
jgi:hypothetical protein